MRTRPYRSQTNGNAERFIRTLLSGWACGAICRDSAERTAALAGWVDFYNRRRPHGALSHKPPIARLNELNKRAWSYSWAARGSHPRPRARGERATGRGFEGAPGRPDLGQLARAPIAHL